MVRESKDRLLAVAKGFQLLGSVPEDFIERLRLWQEPLHPTLATIRSPNLPRYTDFVGIGSEIAGRRVTKSLFENIKLGSSDSLSGVVVLEAHNLCSGAMGARVINMRKDLGQYPNLLCIKTNTSAIAISESPSPDKGAGNSTYQYEITTP
ncbi:hypothetical protein GCG54_00009075 [Colletotrichum gloeosporioides]|uniref:Uncharacterized protein n=1 Tax=Colletotrichum gloeosporioides TaxID=474922 RepID=A0A8H8WNJ0_COLGL|nr:uncharacterized protein GCG54_00009075 [Colletotrichum gloeosporioides]KAF3797106.1 hypothetical protein GCG54_00009075 [Colletotrichum gloeosporioides]